MAFGVIAYLVGRVDSAEYLRVFYVPGGQDIAVFCAAIVGACLGFLWFNCSPAEVFMGDTGSQALGGALGLVALNTKQEFLVLLVGAVFVMEALSVALQIASFRLRGGKRVFLCAPIHHHYQYKGWPESKIVLRFWIVAALFALIALATLKARVLHGPRPLIRAARSRTPQRTPLPGDLPDCQQGAANHRSDEDGARFRTGEVHRDLRPYPLARRSARTYNVGTEVPREKDPDPPWQLQGAHH